MIKISMCTYTPGNSAVELSVSQLCLHIRITGGAFKNSTQISLT